MIESLLAKPSQKPDFKNGLQSLLSSSSALTKAKAFMPQFVATTDRLLNDPSHAKQMDIEIIEQQQHSNLMEDAQFEQPNLNTRPGQISMVTQKGF
jgi:hypothetical protein